MSQTEVEETTVNQNAAAINLATAFSASNDMVYTYKVEDLDTIVESAPSFVKITQVPSHGHVLVQKVGEWQPVQAGDIVEAAMLKNFVYEQAATACTLADKAKCNDEIKFIPLGAWTGAGQYQTTKLNLIPVESAKALAVDAAKTTELAGPAVQTKASVSDQIKVEEEEPVAAGVAAGTCSDNTAGLIVLILLSVLPLLVIGVFSIKIKNMSVGDSQFEMARFDSATSKKAQDAYAMDSDRQQD